MKISKESKFLVDHVFDKASLEGRNNLFEHEVYQILDSVGLATPKYHFIKMGEEVTPEILSRFSDEVIVKIVSTDIAHKSKVGGVKKVKNYEPLFVQYVLERMKEEVLSYYSEDAQPVINGYLIIELVHFKQSIGYEILFGVKEDPSFGPVVTLSKGGDDAEFFAKYYDKANLILPPLSFEEGQKLANSLNIRHKFKSIGHEEYSDFIAKTASVISALSYHYSYVNEEETKYYITTMDVNPFVITTEHQFLAVDGYIEFERAELSHTRLPKLNTNNIEPFFNPKGVAVIGVSADLNKYSMGREIARLLHDLGREDLYCVNQNGGEVLLGEKSYPLYKSVEDIPYEVEMVTYAAPAKHLKAFFEGLKNNVPKSVVLIPGISQDIHYPTFMKELSVLVPKETRIIGPNCMGVFYGEDEYQKGVNTLFIDEERLTLEASKYSNTALLTQSGGMAVTLIDKMPNAPIFKAIVSFGNKYDVKITDLVEYFNDDDAVKVI
ncbi:MAG: acetate--CoA ligase family protein, partial [Vallitaleaceae bacterium]|nr:acetate--CoA ligase family protein [Vallitaleaceae bacterium]